MPLDTTSSLGSLSLRSQQGEPHSQGLGHPESQSCGCRRVLVQLPLPCVSP